MAVAFGNVGVAIGRRCSLSKMLPVSFSISCIFNIKKKTVVDAWGM